MTGQRRPSCGEVVEDSHYMTIEERHMHPEEVDNYPQNRERPSSSYVYSATDIWHETRLFMELATTTTLLSLGFILSPLMTASYVGRMFGPVYLSGFTLANLTGNLCTFSILSGLLSASDTLSPQALGKGDYRQVGLLALRGIIAASSFLLPINVVLVLKLEDGLIALGQDPEAAYHAQQWYRIFVVSLPFNIVSNVMWKFLSAQHVMRPMILVSCLCTFVILPLGLDFFIGLVGFLGSAVAYVLFQVSQAVLLMGYLIWKQPHDDRTWSSLDLETLRQALHWKDMKQFLHLGVGGILVQSEWIFWEALGLIVGKLGVIALSVHTIPNQTIMAFCMVPFSFGVALAVRIGVTLPLSVRRTKMIVSAVLGCSTIIFGLVSILVYVVSDWMIGMFTTNDDVKDLAHFIWWKVCLFNFNVAIFGILCGIATGLAKQWTLGVINLFFLWLFPGIPMIYYTTIILKQGLDAAWTWINVPYICMNLCLVVLFLCTDWHAVQQQIKKGDNSGESRSVSENMTVNEASELIPKLRIKEKTDDGFL
ncbi:MATE efflux family protein [Nitzschia inconspicua]|uniref:MATE efflux family protein n=1 Tax=Nitzschia inconspicua TaxID=303405 RepID=A0A9K3KHM3_9STRA|nr:MATE efflux family protein [Nitzschia inconspicua]